MLLLTAAISVRRACEVDPKDAMAINLPSALLSWMEGFGNGNSLLIHLSTDQGIYHIILFLIPLLIYCNSSNLNCQF